MTDNKQKLKKIFSYLIPFVLAPLTVIGGLAVFRSKGYAYITLAVAVLAVFLFFCGFEKKRTGTRRLVIIAVMTALAVAGRFIFSPIPGVSPITPLAIIAALYMGGETGFLVGSMAALISNFYAGQGVWTPFQMLAWGLVGLIAGLLAKKLRGNTVRLSIYAFFSGILYSLIMDIYTVFWMHQTFSLKLYITTVAASLLHTGIYAVSNVIFIILLEKPIGEKLERIKTKYGI